MLFRSSWLAAGAVPLVYLFLYTPYGMDTTDFGYFYGYAWRILEGQMPYRDFSYIKPPLALYWHAMWMWLTPEKFEILGGKAGFVCTILASSWLTALFLAKFFDFAKMGLPLPLLATCGFVFGVHSFPHMPWHTADGILFCCAALFAASRGWPVPAGILAAWAMLCKQSFLLVPLAILILIFVWRPRKSEGFLFILGWGAMMAAAFLFLYLNGAWEQFRAMTTGQLDIREALDAGILIYLRQNWLLPLLAISPWLLARFAGRQPVPWLAPCWCYLAILATWYITQVLLQKTWIGFGLSWPTLFMLLGAVCIFLPRIFLLPWSRLPGADLRWLPLSLAMAASLAVSWSVAISGGYKTPAMCATPLIFCFFVIQAAMGGNVARLAWGTLACGIIMFGAGYQYPYVFPVRPLEMRDLSHDAGSVYPRATWVYVDGDMLARLAELKMLREKYGANYKTLPGFSHAYYLNGDKPVYGSDWLIDWEINGDVDRLYNELVDKKITVFMERDQMDAKKADSYDRAGYTVPQRVRKNWRIVEETPHFVVMQPPLE